MTSWHSASDVRVLDRLVAAVGLVVSAPLLAVAALGIKLSDRGAIVHKAVRIGLDGQPFTMYKFRTMTAPDPSDATAPITGRRDTRVFAWGRVLRRFKVDELPQLLNVVRGEMAIVGPRPEDPSIVDRDYSAWMLETLTVLPGLTSPGSLDYYASESSLPDDPIAAEALYVRDLLPRKLAADLVYVRNRSIAYDASLIVRTLASLVGAHHVFRAQRAAEQAEAQKILREELKND